MFLIFKFAIFAFNSKNIQVQEPRRVPEAELEMMPDLNFMN